ncbi:hypothetical protein HYFRA_00002618 [Hymenoscyphus fraxineus]|uniref:N-acetylgalactosaminide beta-1,3-galactosyltransferase n=1 Tax=Hymenoscyphus fraxineus TaxID=746836 RepID=A0A9N9L6K0_9HELO|nr:hypothetical protein HYFRA_00002618 [Hymenoscyphus fraxineus]
MFSYTRSRRCPWTFIAFLFVVFLIWHTRPNEKLQNFSPKDLTGFLNRTFYEHLEIPPNFQLSIPATVTVTNTKTLTESCPVPTSKQVENVPITKEASFDEQTVEKLRQAEITVIFKTGAQEHSSLPIHLSTTFRQFTPSDVLLFSDLATTIGRFPIHDSLAKVSSSIRRTHPDFQIYRDIQHFHATNQNLDLLKENPKLGDDRKGWVLDKYKFLHMIEETWRLRPDKKWYVFMETDTYLFLPNLVQLLSGMDASRPYYFGSLVSYDDIPFAHGGSGYVLSAAAMHMLLDREPKHGHASGLANRWDAEMESYCCGDFVLALALRNRGIEPMSMYPLLNGQKPRTMAFGPEEMWCQAVVSMHHVLPMEASDLWRFEREREERLGMSNGTTFSELYHHFVEPNLSVEKDNWDNLSHGPTFSAKILQSERIKTLKEEQRFKLAGEELRRKANMLNWTPVEMVSFKSFENCQMACQARDDCFQFVFIDEYDGPTCRLGLNFRLGKYQPPKKGRKVMWKSGWMKQKIMNWAQENPCREVDWNGE